MVQPIFFFKSNVFKIVWKLAKKQISTLQNHCFSKEFACKRSVCLPHAKWLLESRIFFTSSKPNVETKFFRVSYLDYFQKSSPGNFLCSKFWISPRIWLNSGMFLILTKSKSLAKSQSWWYFFKFQILTKIPSLVKDWGQKSILISKMEHFHLRRHYIGPNFCQFLTWRNWRFACCWWNSLS